MSVSALAKPLSSRAYRQNDSVATFVYSPCWLFVTFDFFLRSRFAGDLYYSRTMERLFRTFRMLKNKTAEDKSAFSGTSELTAHFASVKTT